MGVPEAGIRPILNVHSLTTLCLIRVAAETPTLVVLDDVVEVISYLLVNGVMYYVDSHDKDLGYEDFYTKTDMCRAHFEKVSPGTGDVKKFIL
jgi:hypothetical protein